MNKTEKSLREDYIFIDRGFVAVTILFAIIFLFFFLMGLAFYSEGKTDGYNNLKDEIFDRMSNVSCGNYLTLNNYNNTIKLYQEPCHIVYYNSGIANLRGVRIE